MAKRKFSQRKFKNFLINPQFQLKLIGYFIGLFMLTSFCLYSTTFIFFFRLHTKAINVGIPEGHVFFRFLQDQKMDLDLLFGFLTILNFLLLVGTGFVVSHRIAGPMYKLKRHLSEFNLESTEFKLRDKDFFKDLEPAVNGLRDKLK